METDSNETLVAEYQKTRSTIAFNELLQKNTGLLKNLCRSFIQNESEAEDYYQEGRIAFERAARTFKHDRNTKFLTWASYLIKHQLINYKHLMHPKGLLFTPLEAHHYPSYKENYGEIVDLKFALSKLSDWKRQAVIRHYFFSKSSRSDKQISKKARDEMLLILERPPRL